MNSFSKCTLLLLLIMFIAGSSAVNADVFGEGENQFSIDFVTISGDSSITYGYGTVFYDYRIGTYEITNDQWDKFVAINGMPFGDPVDAYDQRSYYRAPDGPVNNVSWLEAVQFVNWLNTSTGHPPAYLIDNSTGTVYLWDFSQASDGGYNRIRNKEAFYFLPSEDEWAKAAYWNGTRMQVYATKDDMEPQDAYVVDIVDGDYVYSEGWNYYYSIGFTWDVGSGSEELNGTYDMMGNVCEWMEGLFDDLLYSWPNDMHAARGGSLYTYNSNDLRYDYRFVFEPSLESSDLGFRVAAKIPDIEQPVCDSYPEGDINGDCKVDLFDLSKIANSWLQCNMIPVSACQ